MKRRHLDWLLLLVAGVLLLAFPPGLFRDLELSRGGEPVDPAVLDLSQARVYDLELTWQQRFWQGSAVEIWVDDCLRSMVANGTDLSPEVAYCDFVGSRRIDLAPYLVAGRATLELEVENLGGPGGVRITGVGNVFFRTYRHLLAFLLILTWLYRKGRVGEPAVFPEKPATVLRTCGGVLVVLLAVIGGATLVWFRQVPTSSRPGGGEGVAQPEAGGRGEAPNVTIPAFTTGAGAPSWAEDERLNPRILVAGGAFLMGSPEGVAYPDEQPRQRVRLSRFWLQRYEVTNEEYRRFRPAHGFTPGQERYPVVNVTWDEALAYAEWLGGSLPTEAQWEFAARGARGRKYPWGDEEPTCARANFNACGWRLRAVGSHPAGATPEGVEDLAGNAWEWCRDWYADRYPPAQEADPRGPTAGWVRVLRGGSLIGGPGYLRSAYRGYYNPGFLGHDIGFRVAWSAAESLLAAADREPS